MARYPGATNLARFYQRTHLHFFPCKPRASASASAAGAAHCTATPATTTSHPRTSGAECCGRFI